MVVCNQPRKWRTRLSRYFLLKGTCDGSKIKDTEAHFAWFAQQRLLMERGVKVEKDVTIFLPGSHPRVERKYKSMTIRAFNVCHCGDLIDITNIMNVSVCVCAMCCVCVCIWLGGCVGVCVVCKTVN